MNGDPMTTGEVPGPRPWPVARQVRVRAGDGLVVRKGALLAVIGEGGDLDAVMARLDRFDPDEDSGAELLSFVRALPHGSAIALVSIGVDIDLVLLGDVRCEFSGPGNSGVLAGSSVAQLVGLPPDSASVVLALAAATEPANPRTTLVDGVTPGGGVEVTIEATTSSGSSASAAGTPPLPPAAPPPPEADAPAAFPPPMPPSASASVVNLLHEVSDDVEPLGAPLPETPEDAAADGVEVKVTVHGQACSVGHINRPSARYCSTCGRRIQGTVNLVAGPRPSLGTLIFDDGAAFGLEHGYVIGREPGIDSKVLSGVAHALTLDDPERTISRVHAEVRLDGWDIAIVDRGSANGTHVASPGSGQWQQLTPDTPVVIADGWSVAIGRRTFVFQQR